MDDTIHQLTVKFLKTLSANLGKTTSKSNPGGGNEVLSDPTLQIIIHMISCTKSLRDAFELSTGGSAAVSTSGGLGSVKKPKSSIHFQLYQPLLNGILVLLGKMLMDSFTYEPKVTETAAFSAAYGILGRHVLTQFPEMATKKHKTSGKMLIHHAVFKARPAIAEETVGYILKVSPGSARAEDATGALPLHWATRNPDVSFEMIDLLLKAYPEAPTKTDNKGFLPLHWAVNQDAPNIEVVRKLIKIFPAGAGMPSLSGNLPLHYCVSRARPSIPVIKALIAAYPEAIRSGCEEGFLPLHRYLYRPIVDLDALRLLINYYPDALMAKSARGQTPLHVALDHHSPDALAVELLLELCPAAVSVADSDRYLPLHLCLDCAEPNYSLATQLLMQHPQAASITTKDEMLPLHLVVGANSDPTHEHANRGSPDGPNDAVDFVNALLNANPAALVTSVRDIIPAMDGEALADPESWSGEWVETHWTPLARARDRGLNGLVKVFRYFQVRHGIADPTEGAPQGPRTGGVSSSGSAKASVVTVQPGSTRVSPPVRAPVADVHFDENNTSMENINFNAAKPVKSQPLYNNNPNNYSGVNPIRIANPDRVRSMASASGDENEGGGYYAVNNATSEDEGAYDANIVNRANRLAKPTSAGTGAPAVKVPPHILKAQQMARGSSNGSQSGDSRASSRERGGAAPSQPHQRPNYPVSGGGVYPDGSLMVESVGELPSYLNAPGGSRDTTPLRQGIVVPSSSGATGNFNGGFNPNASTGSVRSQGSNNKAPPPGPIPASLLQAAENNAQRYAKAAAAVSAGPPVMTAAQLQQINDAAKAAKRSTNSTVPSALASPQSGKQLKQSKSPKGSFNFPEGGGSSKTGLAATTGRAAPSNTRNSGSRNNNNAGEEDADDERVGTAPELGLGKKNRPEPKIVGFGSQSAWSNGEETAEDSVAGQNPAQNKPTPAAPPSVAPAALNAKQQRLLQAQQQYMKRAAGNNAGVPVDAVSSGVISVKPSPSPSTGIHSKAAPTNHTSEIIKNLGGKVRIHPLAGSAQNVKVALNSTGTANVDEMV